VYEPTVSCHANEIRARRRALASQGKPGEAAARAIRQKAGSELKIGIVSDLHCNERGLLRALAIIGNVDALVCLGDSIYDFRFSNEVVRILREREAEIILGNHEEGFFGPQGERARQRPGIDRTLLAWLAEQPHRRERVVAGKKLLIVHSTPWEPRGAYVPPHSPLLARFGEVDADFVLYGHTHRQLVQRVGRVLVINPGSAGEARDADNGRQLSCAVLDTVSEEVVVTDFPDVQAPAGFT
jgi:putative phosphoesterase